MNANALDVSQKGIVYKATNLINNKVYIGITTRKLSSRIGEHKYDSTTNVNHSNTYFHRAMKKYGFNNFAFEILEEVADKNDRGLANKLYELEKKYIELCNSNNKYFGYNLTNGGDGISGYKYSDEQKRQMSLTRKGRRLSEEHKAKISAFMRSENNPNKGKECSLETRRKISMANKGRLAGNKNPMFGRRREDLSERNRRTSKPVLQIDIITGEVIKKWNSAREAERELKISRSSIRKCCLNEIQKFKGYKWKYYINKENKDG